MAGRVALIPLPVIANITHDLKTPLSPIKGYAELLSEGSGLDLQAVQDYGAIILKNVNHMEKLMNDLKLTYQLEAGAIPYTPQEIRIVRFIKELVIDIANDPAFSKRAIEFENDIPETVITADPDLLSRAIGNIVINALVHNPLDTKVKITVNKALDSNLSVSISDNGKGMNETELSDLWNRYYRGTNTKERPEGSGLGLAIAKQIITLHGGDITVKRGQSRKRKTNSGEVNMFSGLLVCSECGKKLHFHCNQASPDIKFFSCYNYKGNRGTCNFTHRIRVDFLEQVVLGEIRRLTKFASKYEALFAQAVMGCSQQNAETEREAMQKEVYSLQARDRELDNLFERIYEDNVAGKITDERFARMSQKYEAEQHDLTARIKELKDAINKSGNQSVTADMFISTVRKYTRAKKLTSTMLNELIQYIVVYPAEKIDGVWEQQLEIHYNCIGVIDIPADLPLPAPTVSVNTRKGVTVTYVPMPLAS